MKYFTASAAQRQSKRTENPWATLIPIRINKQAREARIKGQWVAVHWEKCNILIRTFKWRTNASYRRYIFNMITNESNLMRRCQLLYPPFLWVYKKQSKWKVARAKGNCTKARNEVWQAVWGWVIEINSVMCVTLCVCVCEEKRHREREGAAG